MNTKYIVLFTLVAVTLLYASCTNHKATEEAKPTAEDTLNAFFDSLKLAEANDDDPANDGYDSLRRMGVTAIVDSEGGRSIINGNFITAIDTIKVKKR